MIRDDRNNFKKNILLAMSFICLALFAFIVARSYLYTDDYHYAGFLKEGWAKFFSLNKLHYKEVNGRALVHFLLTLSLSISRKLMVPLNLIFLVGYVFFFLASMEDWQGERRAKGFLVFFFLLLSLPIEIERETYFWAAGSFNYLFPAFLLAGYYYFFKAYREGKSGLTPVLIFGLLSALTTEQAGATAFIIGFFFFLEDLLVKKKKPEPRLYLLSSVLIIAGLASVVLAPGTAQRLTEPSNSLTDNFFLNLGLNYAKLANNLVSREGLAGLLLMVLSFIGLHTWSKGKNHLLAGFSLFNLVFIGLVSFLRLDSLYLLLALRSLALALAAINILVFIGLNYRSDSLREGMILCLVAMSLQLAMVFSPINEGRTFLISGFFLASALLSFMGQEEEPERFLALLILIAGAFNLDFLPWLGLALLVYLVLRKKQDFLVYVLAFLLTLACLIPVALGYDYNYRLTERNLAAIERGEDIHWNIDYREPYKHKLFFENQDFLGDFYKLYDIDWQPELYYESNIYKTIEVDGKALKRPRLFKESSYYYPILDIAELVGSCDYKDNRDIELMLYARSLDFKGSYIYKDDESKLLRRTYARVELHSEYIREDLLEDYFHIVEKDDRIILSKKER